MATSVSASFLNDWHSHLDSGFNLTRNKSFCSKEHNYYPIIPASETRQGYPETLLQACTLRTLERVPSEPKPSPTFIQPAPGKHFQKAAES